MMMCSNVTQGVSNKVKDRGLSSEARCKKLVNLTIDELNDEENRRIFFDAVTAFIGLNFGTACKAWSAMYGAEETENGVVVLAQHSLMKEVDGCVWVHDIIRSVAQNILESRDEFKSEHGKRVWKPNQVCSILCVFRNIPTTDTEY
jgi:hypothetical protein